MPTPNRSCVCILLSTIACQTYVHSFTSPSVTSIQQRTSKPRHQSTSKKVIDAEFTHSKNKHSNDDDEDEDDKEMTLIEYSQRQDPEWKDMPIAFCDLQSNTYIDCTLAFYVRGEDGEEYCLGVPCEQPIVVAVEVDGAAEDTAVTNLATVLPINPDDTDVPGCYKVDEDQKKEIFEIAARALSDEYGEQIRLKKTPRVLTTTGDLDAAVGDWKDVLLNSSNDGKSRMRSPDIEEALKILDEDEEEGEKYFDMIMRKDLGDDYEKLLEEEDDSLDGFDEDLLKLFDVNAEDLEDGDMEEFLKFMNDSLGEEGVDDSKTFDELLRELKPSAALRLFSFVGPENKQFTILKPLRPLLLVGKEDPDDYTRRILLSEDEKRKVLPELERVCREKLEEAGFVLSGSNTGG